MGWRAFRNAFTVGLRPPANKDCCPWRWRQSRFCRNPAPPRHAKWNALEGLKVCADIQGGTHLRGGNLMLPCNMERTCTAKRACPMQTNHAYRQNSPPLHACGHADFLVRIFAIFDLVSYQIILNMMILQHIIKIEQNFARMIFAGGSFAKTRLRYPLYRIPNIVFSH